MLPAFSDEERTSSRQIDAVRQLGEFTRRLQAAIVPCQRERWSIGEFGSWEQITDSLRPRPDFIIGAVVFSFDRHWRGQAESREDRIQNVTAKVAERSRTKCLPVAPFERMIDVGSERPLGRSADP